MSSLSCLPFASNAIKLLSADRVIVGGGSGNLGHVQIISACEEAPEPSEAEDTSPDDENKKLLFENLCEVTFKSSVRDIEVCGFEGRALAAVAYQDRSSLTNVSLFSIDTAISSASMTHQLSLASDSPVENIVSLSYSPYEMMLAGATEDGRVIVWDIVSGKCISDFYADACGVSKVLFSKSGQLLTAGSSSRAQLQLFDIRSSGSGSGSGTGSKQGQGSTGGSYFYRSRSRARAAKSFTHPALPVVPSYTALCEHTLHPWISCGTSDGEVADWDLRMDAATPVGVHQPHNAPVSAISLHPVDLNAVITASQDGTVCACSSSASSSTHVSIQSEAGTISKYSREVLVVEPCGMTALDSSDAGVVVATSAIGGLWRVHM
jgi:WD40 repeat protein